MSTGTFIVSYESATPMPGSPVLRLDLVVDMVHAIASGTAHVTQAVNPPLDVKLPVSGPVITMTVMPKVTHFQLKLESPSMPGRHISVLAVIDGDWQSGTANVTLWLDTQAGLVNFTTPLKVVAPASAVA